MNISLLTIDCELTERRKAECGFAHTHVDIPNQEQIQKELAELKLERRSA